MKLEEITLRRMEPSDEPFIYSTWLRGLYYGNDWFQEIPRFIYFKKYHDVITVILAKPNVCTLAACFVDEPDVIISYAVIEKEKLHWIFTKSAWRRFGIAKRLLEHQSIKEVTHLTKLGKSLKPKEWVFNPFLF